MLCVLLGTHATAHMQWALHTPLHKSAREELQQSAMHCAAWLVFPHLTCSVHGLCLRSPGCSCVYSGLLPCPAVYLTADCRMSVVKAYCGHGIGDLFHCSPSVPHYSHNKVGSTAPTSAHVRQVPPEASRPQTPA